MKVFTSHFRTGDDPVLVREGYSMAAALLGPFWFLAQRAWIPAAIDTALTVLLGQASLHAGNPAPFWGYLALRGIFARDLQRWSLARRGFAEGPVVAATEPDAAYARLLTQQSGQP